MLLEGRAVVSIVPKDSSFKLWLFNWKKLQEIIIFFENSQGERDITSTPGHTAMDAINLWDNKYQVKGN